MPYDSSTRLLAGRDAAPLLSYVLHRRVDAIQVRGLPTELTGPSVRADSVFEVGQPPELIHLEFEKNARPERIQPRLLTYFERLHSAYGLAPQQFVIVLEPSNGRLSNTYNTGGARLTYNVIHLWDEPPGPLLADLGLSPLAVLAHRTTQETAIDRVTAVLDRINTVAEPERRRQLALDAFSFGTIILDRPTLIELLRRYPAMPLYAEEMPLYQEGLERGLEQGLERGLEQGLERGEARALSRILQRRFPLLAAADTEHIATLDRTRLDRLAELALEFATLEDLREWLGRA